METAREFVTVSVSLAVVCLAAWAWRSMAIDTFRQVLFFRRDELLLWWADNASTELRPAYDAVRDEFNLFIRFSDHITLLSASMLAWRLRRASGKPDFPVAPVDGLIAALPDGPHKDRLVQARTAQREAVGLFLLFGSASGLVFGVLPNLPAFVGGFVAGYRAARAAGGDGARKVVQESPAVQDTVDRAEDALHWLDGPGGLGWFPRRRAA